MDYELILAQFDSLFENETNLIAIYANTSALIKENFGERINWAGFYFLEGSTLVLGPFQGKTACMRLYEHHGVCQKALELNTTLMVDDVLNFAGHIACDSDSRSELVVPLYKDNKAIGVLDLDSPRIAGFSQKDKDFFEALVRKLEAFL